jgi:hypothetical protein
VPEIRGGGCCAHARAPQPSAHQANATSEQNRRASIEAAKHTRVPAEKGFTNRSPRGTAAAGVAMALDTTDTGGDATSSSRHSLIALAICAFAYLYAFPYQHQLNNPNENVRFYMTAALVEQGRYEIDSMRARFGWVNDAATHGGHVYSVKAPGTSLLAVPGYALYLALGRALGRPYERTEALFACRLFASILPTLLWLWWWHRWLVRRGHHPVLRDAVFFSVALGSLLYGYGMLMVSHTLSAATAFGAFMLLSDARETSEPCASSRAAAAGLLAAATTLFEYPGLPASIALTVYALLVLRPRGGLRALAAYAAGGLGPALAMMHFQWRAFGSPFTPGHLMVENPAFREAHHQGLYGAVGPSFEALYGLLLDLGAGLFPLTPILILAPVGFVLLLRERNCRADGWCALSIVVLTVLTIASMNNWRGGWTIGPRYLALAVPFVAWATLIGLERMAERAQPHVLALALGATLAGLIASGVPSVYYPHLPPELTRPLPQLFAVLIAHDYAPSNAANWLGLYGTASMLPLFAIWVVALFLCVRAVPGWRARALLQAGGLIIALCLVAPLASRPELEPGVEAAVAFITRRFSPEGHDRAAVLAAELHAQQTVRDEDLRRLAELYAIEGREQEAERARRGKL